MKNNTLEKLIKYRKEGFYETYEYVVLTNNKKAIMFFPTVVGYLINLTLFIGEEHCRLLATFDKEDKNVSIGDIQVLQ